MPVKLGHLCGLHSKGRPRNIRLGCGQLTSLGNYGLNYGRKTLLVHIDCRSNVFLTRITAPTGSSNPFHHQFGRGLWSWFWFLDLVLNKTNSNEKGLTLWLLNFMSKSIRPKRLGTDHRDHSRNIERAWVRLNTGMTLLHNKFAKFS